MKAKLYSLLKLLFLIFLLSGASNINAQNNTVYLYQEWVNNSQWQNLYRYTITLNGSCQDTYGLQEFWGGDNEPWINANQQYFYYNNSGLLDSVLEQQWIANGWVNNQKIYYTENTNHQFASQTILGWNGVAFVNRYLSTWTYDVNSFFTSLLNEVWDSTNNKWLNQSLTSYTNNTDGTPSVELIQTWNVNTQTWDDSYRVTYSYTGYGKDSLQLFEIYSNGSWKNSQKTVFLYDGNHYLINYIDYNWLGSMWSQFSQDSYSNNAKGLDTLSISQQWNAFSNSWENSLKMTTSYASCVLPLKIIHFTAQPIKNSVELNWQTGSEVNTSLFHLQRSTDGKIYTTIGNIPAKGYDLNNYSYNDNITNIHQPTIYYRLLEQDKDGKLQTGNVVAITLDKPVSLSFVISPNPATDKIFITGGNPIIINIYDLSGKLLISTQPAADKSVDVSQLHKGVYMVRIKDTSGNMSTSKLIIE